MPGLIRHFSGKLHSFLLLFLLLASQISAQTPSARVTSGASSVGLPARCLSRDGKPQQIADLLEALQEHPTAGAYNTLGALFAQQGSDRCAIAAFEAAIRLDDRNWEAHYNLAVALIRSAKRARAADDLHRALQLKPDSANAHFALATLLAEEHKTDQAAKEFESVLSIAPDFVPASLSLADVLLAQKKYAAAEDCLEKAVALSPPPDQADALKIALSKSYAQSGNPVKASDLLKALVAERPQSAQAHFHLGIICAQNREANDTDAAIKEFETALQLDSHLNEARLALGTTYINAKKYSVALTLLTEYIRSASSNYEGYYQQGIAYSGLNQWNEAVHSLKQAVRLRPAEYDLRLALGDAFVHTGETEQALTQFQEAAKIDPKAAEVHHQLAALLEHTHPDLAKKESARYRVLKAAAGDPEQAARWTDRANQAFASGHAADSAESYRKAIQFDPRNARLHYNLALALDQLGDRKGERLELQKAIQLDPGLAPAHNQLGLLALATGELPEAEREFKNALRINQHFAEAKNNLGVLYSREGKDQEAAIMFRQAIEDDPKYAKAHANYGLALAQHGAYSEAEQQFHLAVQTDPADPAGYTALGMLEAKTARGREAVEDFRKALALQPDSEAHLNLGIALADQYDASGAFKEFSEAVRLDPKSAASHYNLGRYYYQIGDYGKAQTELSTACNLQPDFRAALYFLALVENQNNQLQHSTELLIKLVALEPGNADAQYLLGQNLERLGQTNDAIQHWKLAIQADPNHSQVLYNLARTLQKLNDPSAQQYQERFEALQKMQRITDRVQQLGNFALEAAQAQNWPQAFQQMQEALELCGNCAEAAHLHRNLGLFYCRTGKIEEGGRELHTALALDPSDGDAQKTLAALDSMRAASSK